MKGNHLFERSAPWVVKTVSSVPWDITRMLSFKLLRRKSLRPDIDKKPGMQSSKNGRLGSGQQSSAQPSGTPRCGPEQDAYSNQSQQYHTQVANSQSSATTDPSHTSSGSTKPAVLKKKQDKGGFPPGAYPIDPRTPSTMLDSGEAPPISQSIRAQEPPPQVQRTQTYNPRELSHYKERTVPPPPSQTGHSSGVSSFDKFRTMAKNFVAEPAPGPAYHQHAYGESKQERYRRERNQLEVELVEKNRLLHHKEDMICEMMLDLDAKRDELDARREELERERHVTNQLHRTLDQKELFLGRQLPDEEILTKFDCLNASIKTWSANFTGAKNAIICIDESDAVECVHVAPFYLPNDLKGLSDAVAGTKKKRRLFVRGYASYQMSLLFRTLDTDTKYHTAPIDLWLDPETAVKFGDIEQQLYSSATTDESQRKFHNWRALTAELLSKQTGQGSSTQGAIKNLRRLAQEVIRIFQSWAVHRDALQELEDTLYMIYCDAVNLSQMLRQQRASWSVKFPKRRIVPGHSDCGGLGFEPHSMHDVQFQDEDGETQHLLQQAVEFVVTPALTKRGTVNGDKLDVEYACMKASVLMYVTESSEDLKE